MHGTEGTIACSTLPEADFVVSAIVGVAGLEATHAAILAGKPVGLANKECMVAAGEILTAAARERKVPILPIDSEHNAVHQCLRVGAHNEVKFIWLTASGGPFRQLPLDQFESITPEQALKHPTWVMGRRITIDSATMLNKGLEVIEACRLFDVAPARCGSPFIRNPRCTRWWSTWTARSWRKFRSPICACPSCTRWHGRSGLRPRSPSIWPRCGIWNSSRPISSASLACGWLLKPPKKAVRTVLP